jgi:hypothetical protein
MHGLPNKRRMANANFALEHVARIAVKLNPQTQNQTDDDEPLPDCIPDSRYIRIILEEQGTIESYSLNRVNTSNVSFLTMRGASFGKSYGSCLQKYYLPVQLSLIKS